MKPKFYITTPIYYTNGVPHIGHAYSSLIADVIARYKRIDGFQVKFTTGVDENSQKALLKAQELGMDIMEYLDMMASKHLAVWDGLDISYTDYIRTTEPRHHKFVQSVIKKTYENGFIRKGNYEGLYCIGCESFKKPEELNADGLCPDHLTKPEVIKEENYFFELSKFQKTLESFYEKNPDFTIPNNRFNEMKTFLKEGLEDFSISRNKKLFGIPFPLDNEQVTYVWYDALFNYLTVCQDGDEDFWPADLHIVGKEIARFHVIYWPAMLEAAGYEKPKNILVTGFITVDSQKISKSIGNVIDPVEFSQKYSRDLMLLYLLTSFPIGQDGDFSEEQAVLMYNAKLANNLGNLLNRFLVLSLKIGGKIGGIINDEIRNEIDSISNKYMETMDEYNPNGALSSIFEFCDKLNKFIDNEKPWNLDSETEKDRIEEILYNLGEGLRIVGIFLYPFFTAKMSEMLTRLGMEEYPEELADGKMKELLSKKEIFTIKEKGEPLYPRIQ
ncbi:MAG: methionine--tRNA ligase [Candidatus Gracilibacteria bacterium]|nr:methionine--tRNA ligase [Candidatus Gracilibacteria bacterium]